MFIILIQTELQVYKLQSTIYLTCTQSHSVTQRTVFGRDVATQHNISLRRQDDVTTFGVFALFSDWTKRYIENVLTKTVIEEDEVR